MLSNTHMSINDLFTQLGLPSNDKAVDNFIDKHRGLPQSTRLEDAPFWSASQAAFIEGALNEDAEWAEAIDQLNMRLR
ncbi:DUF2789 domain-containing protein [Aestuariibacter sp. AA17]|uniref:DUF2789 domain-containing protein n=1 Tax=Fluctibacter corallii TaxID=2984329 RepID=A0ABT3A3L0_9ALTE|nr:DUF2789 domain-containing protein [Aestuariibacter sp. AA17]MCV2883259.1 DUF2789 domain-containing protein [Aestuariibacter sp. AA17]